MDFNNLCLKIYVKVHSTKIREISAKFFSPIVD